MTDFRRTLLWVVFSMSLVLIWDAWQRHNGQPSLFGPAPAAKPVAAGASAAPGAVPTPTTTPVAAAAAPATAPAAAASAPVAKQVTVSTDLVKATLDSKGGALVRLELLKQVDQNDRTKNVVLFDQSAKRLYVAQSGLIPPAGGAGLPNHHTVMELVPGDLELREGSNELQVRFESPELGGVKLAKIYTFRRGDYVIGVRHEVVNNSGANVSPRLYLQLVRDGNPPEGESSFYFTFTGPAVYTDASKFQKVDFKSIEKRQAGDKPDHATTGDNGWVAMVQHYFASAWLPDNGSGAKLPREFYTGKVEANTYSVGMFLPVGEVGAGTTKAFDAQLFAGPQEENRLAALAPGLELVKDYGWFTILAKPLFWLLTQLHGLLGNWGWAIVALVVLLKVAFYWLNASAYRSMAKMKAINPRVMEMRERLKDKPQQMQQEMMRIYREEKVNPLGGCLPIVAQMPFFIALYWVLLSSVEMRNAPWIGWIKDLSAIDPFFILPLLMTGTSLLQTWLNPTPPDPVQAKMMWIMPLIFSVMFFFFPAGLVLYWLTNNILSIAQQYVINKRLGVLGK
ncbi:membrane protein insertase YidC [uncultured Piscinibacter sp.]|uniref:membrane protein insertase YidC n=1 Tax=uncultured Piscinibacter sp. TaxID=1131835 RepID=UPI0026114152|nr:membrane protein insertase YidC [uncultured Piscinibacter sp.]